METTKLPDYKSKKKIIVPERYRFFGDDNERNIEAFINEFEPNTFNVKGMTGCGATTMLLENNQPMIISCPTRELCDNKSSAERHTGQVLWYKKGVLDDDIREYLDTVDVPKFIVVYDSTQNLYKALARIEEEEVGKKYVLAVDEAHMMMTALSYRDSAIKSLTALTSKFDNVQFITATPLEAEFAPEIFTEYNYVEYDWEGSKKVEVKAIQQKSPIKAVCNFIERFKIYGKIPVNNEEGEEIEAKELIFFINSVKDIATVIKTTNLTPDDCKIIVATKYHNTEILARAFEITSKELKLAKASDPNKKYTFVTSKAFEGVDFYSESALSIVVSSVKTKSTLLDMGVSLPQIAGRIRTPENRLKGTLLFIYNTTSYDKSPEEQEKEVQIEIKDAQHCVDGYYDLKTENRRRVMRGMINSEYKHGLVEIKEFDEQIIVKLDQDAIKLKRYQNYITGTYCSQLKIINTIKQKSNVRERDKYFEENVVISYLSKQPFKKVAEEYIKAKMAIEGAVTKSNDSEEVQSKKELIEMLDKENPLLLEAFNKLGAEKMQTASNRSEKNLKAAVTEFDKMDILRIILRDKFDVGSFYSNADIIGILKPEFSKKDIKPVKAINIAFFFDVESKRQKNQSTGKMDKGYLIKKPIGSYMRSLRRLLGKKVA